MGWLRLTRLDHAIVVGGGVGGLVAAVELARRGLQVTVLERAAAPGGKMREVRVDGLALDAGPTVLTMRWVLDQVFADAGATLDDHLVLRPLDVLARHAWDGGARLDLHADVERSGEAIGDFAGAAEARRFHIFCERARDIFRTLDDSFMRAQKPTPLGLVKHAGLGGLPGLWNISPFQTLWAALGEYFHDPRLRQLFARYATYCGSSPFLAPATLMLVAHAEQCGVWTVDGGMHRVAAALAALAERQGARLRYDAEVAEVLVRDGRCNGVQLRSGERLDAAFVVLNADAAALANGLFGRPASRAIAVPPRRSRSLSAITWNLVAGTSGFPLSRHTVFFSRDYATEFDDIFARGRLPREPTVYVCAQDRDEQRSPQAGARERLLCLVNAPPDGDGRSATALEIEQCETRTFELMRRCGLEVDRRNTATTMTTPRDFERIFPGTGGALYGRASHGWASSFDRPGSATRIKGLYLAGGSVHPGPGVPMAAISGRLAAGRLMEDRDSTSRSRRTAMPGGMSTP